MVLANIQRLLDAGVAVLIRLNMDEHNADNLMKLADELHERFGENKKLTVYSHVLYEFLGCKEGISADSRNELYQKQQALYHKLVTLGYVKKLVYEKTFRSGVVLQTMVVHLPSCQTANWACVSNIARTTLSGI